MSLKKHICQSAIYKNGHSNKYFFFLLSPAKMIAKLLLCLLLAYIPSYVLCKDVYINSTFAIRCSDPSFCYFMEPALWNNNIPPEANDNVYLTDLPDYAYITFNQSYPLNFYYLFPLSLMAFGITYLLPLLLHILPP